MERLVDEVRVGQSVALGVGLPVLHGHEAELGLAVVGLAGRADLLQAAVVAEVEAGEVDHHLLAEAVFVVEASLIDREGQGGRLVLDYERLIDVARGVARHDAALDDVMPVGYLLARIVGDGAVGVEQDCLVLEPLLELEYADIGLDRGFGHLEPRIVHVGLT